MKKISKLLLVSMLIGISSTLSVGQISVAGQLNLQRMASVGGSTGLGLKGFYAVDDKYGFKGGFDFFLPSKNEYETSASALSSTMTPSSIDFTYSEAVSFVNLSVGGYYYLKGEDGDDFSVFAFAEAGLVLAPITYSYDYGSNEGIKNAYNINEFENETLGNFTIGGGIGAEYKVGPGFVFGQAYLTMPANTVNGVEVGFSIPPAVGVSFGYRFPFDL